MTLSEFFVIISNNGMWCLIIVITVVIVTYQNVYFVLRCPLLLLF